MPIIEIVVLLKVGSLIGVLNTIGLVILTAFIGVNLLRQQGISTLAKAQHKVQTGELPARELVEGIFLAVGGALLLTPGFVTDVIGFCCLLPGIRHFIIGWGLRHISVRSYSAQYSTNSQHQSSSGPRETIIDGEFEREDSGKHEDNSPERKN